MDNSLLEYGDRGCSTVGGIDGDMEATVIISVAGFVVTFGSLLGGVGSSGSEAGVRVEDTALGSVGLGVGVGKVGK